MNAIKDQSLHVFLDNLASKNATPGGGSVAALMGAQSAALISMVCNLTLGKANYQHVEEDMHTLLTSAESLRLQFTDMIQADINVFDKLMAAYRLPKETDEEISARSELIQHVLTEAIEVPLLCAKACKEAMDLCQRAAEKGNLGVISDAGVGIMAAYAGLKSAALNVQINANCLKDEALAATKRAELNALLDGADALLTTVYQVVESKL
ncbi:MAG: methenyltetrahydrofolate cyclohydrolase [Methylococcaceae bacterium]|jgi:formiminotetrahydrofolate cyclodeaminase|nr:MAG: methenyltetrahydrofolate cyclohydrolase [Methylococcaceae bacterium]